MSNLITIELCAEDRARLDRLAEALEKSCCTNTPVQKYDPVQEALAKVINKSKAQESSQTPTGAEETPAPTNTTIEEEKPTQEETEPTTPPTRVVDRAELKALVIKLCANGKKAESRDIILKYAPTLASVPEDKIAECYEKLVKLGG